MKGYALLTGVNKVKTSHYKKDVLLHCAKTDVVEMELFLNRIPYFRGNIKPFFDENATFDNIVLAIEDLNKKVDEKEAYLVIYFSGHGASIPKEVHQLGNESIGYFCFYDRMISEHEIRSALSKIDSKFSVFVISDSCHSGEIIDLAEAREYLSFIKSNTNDNELPKTKSLPFGFMKDVFEHPDNHARYISLLKENMNGKFIPKAETAILTACKREQVTETNYYNGMPSAFTQTLLSSWSTNLPVGHSNFQKLLASRRSQENQPQINFFGQTTTDFFSNSRPFAVNARTSGIDDLTFDHFEEEDGSVVMLKYLPSGSSGFKYKDSNSYKITELNHGVPDIIQQLNTMGCDLRNVGVIGIVEISLNSTTPFPQEIERYKIDEATGVPGIVVVVNVANNQILHKGRTKGKVSNSIGG